MSDRPPISLVELSAMDVGVLAGVGPRKLDGLRHLGITSLLDLLTHYPRRYIDRTREAQIRELSEGEEALVLGRVASVSSRRVRGGRVIVVAELREFDSIANIDVSDVTAVRLGDAELAGFKTDDDAVDGGTHAGGDVVRAELGATVPGAGGEVASGAVGACGSPSAKSGSVGASVSCAQRPASAPSP